MSAQGAEAEIFDVFLCHNREDKPAIREIAQKLAEKHLKPWLDEEEIRPGTSWQQALGQQIKSIKCAAVFVGESGFGPWQDQEIQALLSQFVKRQCPVIPVVLPSAQTTPELPWTLANLHWVDFRTDSHPLERLIWGITGEKPAELSHVPASEEPATMQGAVRRGGSSLDALRGGYGFLTDYRSYSEAQARGRVATLVQTFGIKEFQFYDWFATYSKSTNGPSWPDPFKHERQIYRETILTYIDEIHRHGGRAWAYVQAAGADEVDLADPSAGIYPLLDRDGNRYGHPPEAPTPVFWTYFLNDAWADRMTDIWGPAVKDLGFDGIHWDTLGRKAGDYGAEVNGTHAFLRRAKGNLAALGLSQTINFVELAWWDPDLVASGLVAFPYAEVWSMISEKSYYAAMNDPALAGRWGVMAFYPTADKPEGQTDSEVMLARWAEAPKHRLVYLILGDNESRLIGPYFPDATPLSPSEKATMAASLPVFP